MITLVLGGTRSGKSSVAERLAANIAAAGGGGGAVTYVATASPVPDDHDHLARVAMHQARRPDTWTTIESSRSELAAVIAGAPGIVLVDSLGSWVGLHLDLRVELEPIVAALAARRDPTIVVSEEVGLSVHPVSELGRRFVDVLGELNQRVSAIAERVLFVVAGRAIDLIATSELAGLAPEPSRPLRPVADDPPSC